MTLPGPAIKGFSSRPSGFLFSDPNTSLILVTLRSVLPDAARTAESALQKVTRDAMRKGMPVNGPERPFWKVKTLEEMTAEEWEALCDGCGVCCLEKFEDVETGEVEVTAIACEYLDTTSSRCLVYGDRTRVAHDCIRLTPERVRDLVWLPETCAYRLIDEGKDLFWWHPLVSGDPETVHEAGISVRGRVTPGPLVPPENG